MTGRSLTQDIISPYMLKCLPSVLEIQACKHHHAQKEASTFREILPRTEFDDLIFF